MIKQKINSQRPEGFVTILMIIALLSISFTIFKWSAWQALKDLKKIKHEELKVDKLLVKRALAFDADCSSISSFTCTGSSPLKVNDLEGNDLIVNSGKKMIGGWNVRVRCVSDEYEVQIARLNSNGGFKTSPFTNKQDSWKKIGKLETLCVRERKAIVSIPCYGADTGGNIGSTVGHTQLPHQLITACNSSSPTPCQFAGIPSDSSIKHGGYTYCPDGLGSFPACPLGFQAELKYIDRFGWGGIDFTKITICVRSEDL